MERYPFIFSNERRHRIRRHLFFWLFWLLFMTFLYGYTPVLEPLPLYQKFLISATEAAMYMTAHMFMAYSLMYFVIPKFIVTGKYFLGALAVIVICLITGMMSGLISVYILQHLRVMYIPFWRNLVKRQDVSIWLSLLAGLRGGLTIGGMAAAIKLMKHWYMKEQRNMQLQKENTEAQLQLLKAQVHPHFLFNTLNNIYSHTQDKAPVASQLVMGLSEMLRYILYECRNDKVPLSKELAMLKEYMSLEKVRYGNKLELNIDLPENTGDLLIAPLLLLPFAENAFKHGTSQMIDQPWISFTVSIDNNVMTMQLVNGKPAPGETSENIGGIGIENVKRRLGLLYPDKHNLSITDEEEVFIVNLKIELEKTPAASTTIATPTAMAYA